MYKKHLESVIPRTDLNKIILRPPLESDYDTIALEDDKLDWDTTPSVLRTWMNRKFTDGFMVADYNGQPVGEDFISVAVPLLVRFPNF